MSHKSDVNGFILHSVVKQGHNMVGTTAINYEGEFEMRADCKQRKKMELAARAAITNLGQTCCSNVKDDNITDWKLF